MKFIGTANAPGYGRYSSDGEQDSQENNEMIADDKASTPSSEPQRTIQGKYILLVFRQLLSVY